MGCAKFFDYQLRNPLTNSYTGINLNKDSILFGRIGGSESNGYGATRTRIHRARHCATAPARFPGSLTQYHRGRIRCSGRTYSALVAVCVSFPAADCHRRQKAIKTGGDCWEYPLLSFSVSRRTSIPLRFGGAFDTQSPRGSPDAPDCVGAAGIARGGSHRRGMRDVTLPTTGVQPTVGEDVELGEVKGGELPC
jgi:hypothetical protein